MTMTDEVSELFKPAPGKPSDKSDEVFNAAFPDAEERKLVTTWLLSIEAALGIDCMFATEGGKLERIALAYPLDVLGSLAKRDGTPPGDCIDRLAARGFIVNAVSHKGRNVILCAVPLDEALRQAKVWRDDSDDDDLVTITVATMTKRGFVTGTIEPL
jgi:hypothetical protein